MPATPIENCLTYSQNTTCAQCVFGFSLDANNCTEITLPNCQRTTPSDNSKCLICDAGLLAVEGQCKEDSRCSIENCRYCAVEEGTELCALCESGFSLVVGESGVECKEDGEGVKDCITLAFGDEERCGLCRAGFYMNNGSCLESEDYEVNQEGTEVFGV